MKKLPIHKRKCSKLDQHHIDYLYDQRMLRECAHLSLIQSAVMFHRTFPEIKISATLLQTTNKMCGIKFKFIHRGKKVIDYTN